MSTYEELEKEFLDKIEKLRTRCRHSELTDWTKDQYIPKQTIGYWIRYCKKCRKIVDRKIDDY